MAETKAERDGDPRRRAVTTAVRLFRRQGFHATGVAQIVEESGSPRGSFYFYFPGGKEQLGAEAVAYAGAAIEALWERAADEARDAADFLRRVARAAARWLERSGWQDGCPVAVVALEATPDVEALRAAADAALGRWARLVARRLRRDGVQARRARALAVLFVAAFEGALLMARAGRRPDALELAGRELERLARAAAREGRVTRRAGTSRSSSSAAAAARSPRRGARSSGRRAGARRP
jgi:TetR/AcrR family transcriptional repressor of lmrAB and yxaGH operons